MPTNDTSGTIRLLPFIAIKLLFLGISIGWLTEAVFYPGVIGKYAGIDIGSITIIFLLCAIGARLISLPPIKALSGYDLAIGAGSVVAFAVGVIATVTDKLTYINYILAHFHFQYQPLFLYGIAAIVFLAVFMPELLWRRVGPTIVCLLPIIIIFIGLVLNTWPFDYLYGLTREDRFFEQAQVVMLLSGAAYALYAIRSTPRSMWFSNVLFAAGLLFIAGEEISWGQRLLGIASPDYFMTHNAQQETNIHNMLPFGYTPITATYVLIGFLYPIFTYIKLPSVSGFRFIYPKRILIYYFLPIGVYNVLTSLTTHGFGNFAEIVELIFYAGVFFHLTASYTMFSQTSNSGYANGLTFQ